MQQAMNVLTWMQIREQYPNQWVLVGNPVLETEGVGPLELKHGVVLLAAPDRRLLGASGLEARKGYDSATCLYTGTFPTGRKWLL